MKETFKMATAAISIFLFLISLYILMAGLGDR